MTLKQRLAKNYRRQMRHYAIRFRLASASDPALKVWYLRGAVQARQYALSLEAGGWPLFGSFTQEQDHAHSHPKGLFH